MPNFYLEGVLFYMSTLKFLQMKFIISPLLPLCAVSFCFSQYNRDDEKWEVGLNVLPLFDSGFYVVQSIHTGYHATETLSSYILIRRSFGSTLSISKELKLSYPNLLYLRYKLMDNAHFRREAELLPDSITESDEVYQNAGEKGIHHTDPEDLPCLRVNKKKGLTHSTTTDCLWLRRA